MQGNSSLNHSHIGHRIVQMGIKIIILSNIEVKGITEDAAEVVVKGIEIVITKISTIRIATRTSSITVT